MRSETSKPPKRQQCSGVPPTWHGRTKTQSGRDNRSLHYVEVSTFLSETCEIHPPPHLLGGRGLRQHGWNGTRSLTKDGSRDHSPPLRDADTYVAGVSIFIPDGTLSRIRSVVDYAERYAAADHQTPASPTGGGGLGTGCADTRNHASQRNEVRSPGWTGTR